MRENGQFPVTFPSGYTVNTLTGMSLPLFSTAETAALANPEQQGTSILVTVMLLILC